jgi:hypothetical protein
MHKYTYNWTLVLALSFFLIIPALANNEEVSAAEEIASDNSLEYEICVRLDASQWLDDSYCYLKYGVRSTAHTLNNWFKHDGGNNLSSPNTKGRLRFGWEPRSGDFSELDFRFRIRVKLPALEDRVELFFSDQEDDVGEQTVKAARTGDLGNRDQTVLAIQFKNHLSDKVSYRVGFGRGSQLYTRARYADRYDFEHNSTLRYYAEAHYYSGDKLGFEANIKYSYVFDSASAFELSNSYRYRDNRNDWLWRHTFEYIHLAKNDTSYLFTASIDGRSQPSYRKEQMLLSMRYKRKVLRSWLYLEIEPFVLWLREEDFRASFGLAIRTEIHFST